MALKVNASIGTVDTKASGTQWSRYDQIGISTVDGTATSYANVCYEWDGGSFTTPADNAIYFQSPETVAFHAYYPFTGEPGTAVQPLTGVSTDATNQTAGNQPLIDFLCASGATANSYKPIGYDLGTVKLTGTFNPADGTAAADDEEKSGTLGMDLADGTLTSSVILFPQTVTALPLYVKYNGERYKATLNIPEGALKAGNNYTYTVKVRNRDIEVSQATIAAWNKIDFGEVGADL